MPPSLEERELTPIQARLVRWIGMAAMLVSPRWFWVSTRGDNTASGWVLMAIGMGGLFGYGLMLWLMGRRYR